MLLSRSGQDAHLEGLDIGHNTLRAEEKHGLELFALLTCQTYVRLPLSFIPPDALTYVTGAALLRQTLALLHQFQHNLLNQGQDRSSVNDVQRAQRDIELMPHPVPQLHA